MFPVMDSCKWKHHVFFCDKGEKFGVEKLGEKA